MTEVRDQELQAHPAEALLGATSAGTLSLLLGRHTTQLASAITRIGGGAIRVVVHESVLTECVAESSAAMVVTAFADLPFPAATFDTVFAPYLRTNDLASTSAGSPRDALLKEWLRVLKPGGRLIVSVANPRVARLLSWARAALPNAAETNWRGFERAPLPYLPKQMMAALHSAGFPRVLDFVVWPRVGDWSMLFPASSIPGKQRRSLARQGGTRLRRIGTLLGVSAGRLFVAQAPSSEADSRRGAAAPILESLLGTGRWPGGITRPWMGARGRAVALARVEPVFLKIALADHAIRRQRVEITATMRLRDSHVDDIMLECLRTGTIGALSYAAYPVAESLRLSSDSERVRTQAEVFRLLGGSAELKPLHTTPAWHRIFSPPSRTALDRLGAADLCMFMERTAADRSVPVGIVHGDLQLTNVMRFRGRTVLVDWDRSELSSPLVLDRCYGIYRLLTKRLLGKLGNRRYLAALEAMSRRLSDVPLLDHIDATAGELRWHEVIILHVLNMGSWRVLDAPGITDSVTTDLGEQFSFATRLVGGVHN